MPSWQRPWWLSLPLNGKPRRVWRSRHDHRIRTAGARRAVAAPEPSVRASVLLAGVKRPVRSALHMQMTNLINHDTKLSSAGRDSAIGAIPARIDSMMAADAWMQFFLTYDPAATARRVKTPVLIMTARMTSKRRRHR